MKNLKGLSLRWCQRPRRFGVTKLCWRGSKEDWKIVRLRKRPHDGAYGILSGANDHRQGTVGPRPSRLRKRQDQLHKDGRTRKTTFEVDHQNRWFSNSARFHQVFAKPADLYNVVKRAGGIWSSNEEAR